MSSTRLESKQLRCECSVFKIPTISEILGVLQDKVLQAHQGTYKLMDACARASGRNEVYLNHIL